MAIEANVDLTYDEDNSLMDINLEGEEMGYFNR